MKLQLNKTYKIDFNLDPLEESDYKYFICTGEKEEYYILTEFKTYCSMNSMDYNAIEDIDEMMYEEEEIPLKHFKHVSSLESIYHKQEEIVYELPKHQTRKFTRV